MKKINILIGMFLSILLLGIGVAVAADTNDSTRSAADCGGNVIESTWGTAPVKFCEETGELDVEPGSLENNYTDIYFTMNEQVLFVDNNKRIKKTDVKRIFLSKNVIAPSDSSGLFGGLVLVEECVEGPCIVGPLYPNLEAIYGIDELNTSNVTSMRDMFNAAYRLKELNLNDWDISKVTNMSNLFSSLNSIKQLDIDEWVTKNVKDMSGMFASFSNNDVSPGNGDPIKHLDLSTFDVSSVENMDGMFTNNFNLESIDFSGWNTSNVKSMARMFSYNSAIQTLDLSNFNTSNVTNLFGMFDHSENLKQLDISSFDTSNVTNMAVMFAGIKSLEKLDLGNFNTSNVTDMSRMFSGAENLKQLDISSFDTSNVTNMTNMFANDNSLQYIKLGEKSIFTDFSKSVALPDHDTDEYAPDWISVVSPDSYEIPENNMIQFRDIMLAYTKETPGWFSWVKLINVDFPDILDDEGNKYQIDIDGNDYKLNHDFACDTNYNVDMFIVKGNNDDITFSKEIIGNAEEGYSLQITTGSKTVGYLTSPRVILIKLPELKSCPTTDIEVEPKAPTLDKDVACEVNYNVVLPTQEGVEYTKGDAVDGKVIVSAKAKVGYVIKEGATTEWTFNITNPEACVSEKVSMIVEADGETGKVKSETLNIKFSKPVNILSKDEFKVLAKDRSTSTIKVDKLTKVSDVEYNLSISGDWENETSVEVSKEIANDTKVKKDSYTVSGTALLFNEVNDEGGANGVDPGNNSGGNTTEGNSNQTDNKLPSTGSDNTILIASLIMFLVSGTVYTCRRFILNK